MVGISAIHKNGIKVRKKNKVKKGERRMPAPGKG